MPSNRSTHRIPHSLLPLEVHHAGEVSAAPADILRQAKTIVRQSIRNHCLLLSQEIARA